MPCMCNDLIYDHIAGVHLCPVEKVSHEIYCNPSKFHEYYLVYYNHALCTKLGDMQLGWSTSMDR